MYEKCTIEEIEAKIRLYKILNSPQVLEAFQNPFAVFVLVTVYRVRKFIRAISFEKCCRIKKQRVSCAGENYNL